MTAAEISLNHGFVAHDLIRLAMRNHRALIEDENALGKRHDDFHDVLDNDEGHADSMDAANEANGILELGRSEAGQRLIEQHQPRLAGKHTRDLEALASGGAQRARALRSLRR